MTNRFLAEPSDGGSPASLAAHARTGRRLTAVLALLVTASLARPLLAATPARVVEYYHLDALGSVRAVTDATGAVIERHDYLPYGEEWCFTPTPGVCGSVPPGHPKRFTGKERDTETGLDYFGARYYGTRIARFTTVDPKLDPNTALVNPQLWNRYSYVSNNPFRYLDPDGRQVVALPPPPENWWRGREVVRQLAEDRELTSGVIWGLIGESVRGGVKRGTGIDLPFLGFQDPRGSEPGILIGESVQRVEAIGKRIRAETMPGEGVTPDNAPTRSQAWVRAKVKSGYTVFDIDIDSTRTDRSPSYRAESALRGELGMHREPAFKTKFEGRGVQVYKWVPNE